MTNRSKAASALNRKRGGALCQRSLQPPCEETLFDAAPRDNCRINGEIAGQFARNDRCRGSITGCELRRRLKLLLVRKRQRLGSFLPHALPPLLPFVDVALFRPAFPQRHPPSTSAIVLPNRNPRVFIFPPFSHFECCLFFALERRKLSRTEARRDSVPRHPTPENEFGWSGG